MINRQEIRQVCVPHFDIGRVFEGVNNILGTYKTDVDTNSAKAIAEDMAHACKAVSEGQEIVSNFWREGTITLDTDATDVLSLFTKALGTEIPYKKRLEIIEKSGKVFSFLEDPQNFSGELQQGDVDAAQQLISKLDPTYKIREITLPVGES